VACGVTAGTAVFEGDAVFAAPAPGGHGDQANAGWGLSVVTTATLAQASTDHEDYKTAGNPTLEVKVWLASGGPEPPW
jgi:hypothetical protein